MIVLTVGENRMIVASFVSTKHRNVMEDRRTDSLVACTAVCIASYGDGCKKLIGSDQRPDVKYLDNSNSIVSIH